MASHLDCRAPPEAATPGMTVSEVCRRHKITSGLFYSWRSRRRRGELGMPGGALTPFLEVQVTPDGAASAGGMIEIALPTGCRVRVDAAVDGAALRRVLAVLAEG